EVARLKDENDRTGGQVIRDGVIRSGTEAEMRLTNEGSADLWVSLFYLDGNLGIKRIHSGSIAEGKSWLPLRGPITRKAATAAVAGDAEVKCRIANPAVCLWAGLAVQ